MNRKLFWAPKNQRFAIRSNQKNAFLPILKWCNWSGCGPIDAMTGKTSLELLKTQSIKSKMANKHWNYSIIMIVSNFQQQTDSYKWRLNYTSMVNDNANANFSFVSFYLFVSKVSTIYIFASFDGWALAIY